MTHSNWPMLEYVPVRGAWERVQYRSIRTARKGMTRVFKERGLFEFAARMDVLRKNPKLNGAEKRLVFEGILNDYAAFVTAQQTAHTTGTGEQPVAAGEPAQEPVPETNTTESAGSVDVDVPDSATSENTGIVDSPVDDDGTRVEPADSVPDVASDDVGELVTPIIVEEGYTGCCANESRNINGACDNCGDPCI